MCFLEHQMALGGCEGKRVSVEGIHFVLDPLGREFYTIQMGHLVLRVVFYLLLVF